MAIAMRGSADMDIENKLHRKDALARVFAKEDMCM
jgi:hypothetical protein